MKNSRTQEGFSLIETLVAGSILSLGLLSLLGSATTAHQVRRESEEKQLVHASLEREIRAIQVTPYDQLVGTHHGRAFDVLGPSGGVGVLEALPGDADGRVGLIEVTAPDPPADPASLLQVVLRVEGRGFSGTRRMTRELRVSAIGERR